MTDPMTGITIAIVGLTLAVWFWLAVESPTASIVAVTATVGAIWLEGRHNKWR